MDFSDPYNTGRCWQFLEYCIRFMEAVEIEPDFENQILEGSCYIKGKNREFRRLWAFAETGFGKGGAWRIGRSKILNGSRQEGEKAEAESNFKGTVEALFHGMNR